MTRSHQESWDGYWREVTPRGRESRSGTRRRTAVQRELPVLADASDPQLPIIDVGCGNGTQTPGGEVLEVPCDYFLFQRAA